MSTRRARASIVIGALALVALAGCGGGAPQSDPGNPNQVELMTALTSPAAQSGLDALQTQFASESPAIDVLDASVAGGNPALKAALRQRLDSGNPPDVVQLAAGADLADFGFADELDDLGPVFAANGLDSAYSPELLDQVTVAGTLYAVPFAIQRANLLWSSSAVLQRAGVDPRDDIASMQDLIVVLTRLRDAGVAYPLAVGDASRQALLLENVMIAELGPDLYDGLWNGQTRWDGDAITRVIATYGALLEFADPAHRGSDDAQAVQAVLAGDAAFVVATDSASRAFDAAGLAYGSDYSSSPTPGTAGIFDFAAATFAIPVGASHDSAARDWITTAGSADGQYEFALAAGTIPARGDVQTAGFSAAQASAANALATNQIVPSLALGAAADAQWSADILSAIDRFHTDRLSTALLKRLVTAAESALA